MMLQECYARFGGNYSGVLSRLRREESVKKFILKFPDDGSYAMLRDGLAEHDYEKAFRGVHTLKGVAQNLSLDRLAQSSTILCEKLRHGYSDDVSALMEQVKSDYDVTVSAILQYKAELMLEGEV